MEDLLINNVRLDEEEQELFLLLLNLGFEQYLEELFLEFPNDFDILKTSCREVQRLIKKFNIDFKISIERNED